MSIESKVGLEAEFLLLNKKDEIIIPPASWDRDGFPLLGEIRGKESETTAETISNFIAKKYKILDKLRLDHKIIMTDVQRIKLALYKKANKEINWSKKEADMGKVKNIYGIDIENYSDQILKGGKIQGIRVSCGLHVHFSCAEHIKYEYEEPQYAPVAIPIGLGTSGLVAETRDKNGKPLPLTPAEALAKQLLKPTLYLYSEEGYNKKFETELYASRLNMPAIKYIVKAMDDTFFERFAAPEKDRTKYRQPGFFEIKPYGFEYRSLPANDTVMEALPEIVDKAFSLLEEINEY